MRFLHLSDLHIGKRLNEFSLLEDQAYILGQILEITKSEQPDGVLIAGDVYDKAAPSAEAVGLFDDFLTRLSRSRDGGFPHFREPRLPGADRLRFPDPRPVPDLSLPAL